MWLITSKFCRLRPQMTAYGLRIYREMQNSGSLYRYLLGTNPSIRIIVNNGRVKLEGIVGYESDKTLAFVAAREIFGVLDVENNLQVEKRAG